MEVHISSPAINMYMGDETPMIQKQLRAAPSFLGSMLVSLISDSGEVVIRDQNNM